jgi:hypothetical protein
VGVVGEKALERGPSYIMASAKNRSARCMVRASQEPGQCPGDHVIHRDVAAPLDMLRKAFEEGEG